MPELPEVETTKLGIKTHLEGQTICAVRVRQTQFRIPVPNAIEEFCAGQSIKAVLRRAKYILLQLSHKGYVLIHLGMSGHLRIVPEQQTPQKHDHIDLVMNNGCALRFCDPRRFGLFIYIEENPHAHPLLKHLGPEPLTDDFNGDYLYQRSRNSIKPIKSFIMTNEIVVGVGNIYATESLFFCGLHPKTPAKLLSHAACQQLSKEIKRILQEAINAGGTTLKDFYSFEGKPGYFSFSLQVYGRQHQPCYHCNSPIEALNLAGRNSAFCPQCQPMPAIQKL
ncbi:MAG: bifunctional DNA-formamidopyrimidine glycosylase/DNA-(apurinic or apyrimidinic site) lyase [Legionella sp.]|nr:MAG: bifunctional DNA-formamidopyrimidine glycosylase/DNA-(apurinic or apyrimidinic site) lyase [Legionella sp.]